MRNLLAHVLVASSLIACASERAIDDSDLPEILVDGAADSWVTPTPFGVLYNDVIQRGEFDAESNVRFPSWQFTVDSPGSYMIHTRMAPRDEDEIYGAQVFLYKRRDAGTWQRIARSPEWQTYGYLSESLEVGVEYRVIAKARFVDASGEFLLSRSCYGEECVDAPQCLVGDEFWQLWGLHRGSLREIGKLELSATSQLSDVMQAQIIAAVNESTHEVSSIAEAFAAVDSEVVNYVRFRDELTSSELVAVEYGAGDSSYGAFFAADSATVGAGIHDGDISNCQIPARACVFGQRMYEAEYMPMMNKVRERIVTDPSELDAVTAQQLMKLMGTTSASDAFLGVGELTVIEYWTGTRTIREFVELRYNAGDTPMGAFFRAGTDEVVAEMSDGGLYNCTAVYE